MRKRFLIALKYFGVGLACILGVEAHSQDFVELSVTGDTSEKITGDCYLQKPGGQFARQRIEGKLPAHFWLPTSAFRCNIHKSSPRSNVVVTVLREGQVEIRQKSQTPLRWIVVRSSGPWGKAKGGVYAARPLYQ